MIGTQDRRSFRRVKSAGTAPEYEIHQKKCEFQRQERDAVQSDARCHNSQVANRAWLGSYMARDREQESWLIAMRTNARRSSGSSSKPRWLMLSPIKFAVKFSDGWSFGAGKDQTDALHLASERGVQRQYLSGGVAGAGDGHPWPRSMNGLGVIKHGCEEDREVKP